MTPTPSMFGPEAGKEIINTFLAAIDEGVKNGYRMFWDNLISALVAHWVFVITALIAILVIALLTWVLTGRWGMLGNVLYNYLYLGTLFLIGLIWGPDIFASNIFSIVGALILYPICFFLVGWILNKTGLRDIY